MTKQEEANKRLLDAVNAVNGVTPCYGVGLKQKWEELNTIVVQKYKEAHNLPNSFFLDDCVSHYNASVTTVSKS